MVSLGGGGGVLEILVMRMLGWEGSRMRQQMMIHRCCSGVDSREAAGFSKGRALGSGKRGTKV